MPKEQPHKLLRTMGRQIRVLYGRQTLPASGHLRDFLSKGEAKTATAGTRGMHDNAVQTHIVILAVVYLPNVDGTSAEPSDSAAMRARGSIGRFEA